MEELVVGRDIVLKELDVIDNLAHALPRKAQLGFSSLREHFSNRLESKSKKGNTVINSSKAQDPMRLEYTCMAVTEDLIAMGCNMGVVFIYAVPNKRLTRFPCEVKQVPVICLEFLEDEGFLAAGQFNGSITLFNYSIESNGNAKILLKCTIDSHHLAPVTCLQWTPDGTKLFSADSEGHVAITVINMDEGQSHTVFICKEDAAVVQLSFCHVALLISSLERTLIWPFNTKTPVQVGQQPRKLFGNFGACFLPKAERLPGPIGPSIFASRPGLRVWKANIEGRVESTMIFKDAINKGEPTIRTLDLPAINPNTVSTDQKQLGCLEVFANDYLVSWQSSSLYVLDPSTGFVVGSHHNLGYVVDIASFNDNLFVLTKDEKHFVRKISLRINMGSPLLEVRERLPSADKRETNGIHRSSSVSQFEETGSLDKLIDDVGSTMVGIISGVKKKVVLMKNRDDDNSPSSEGETATKCIDIPSGPRVVHRNGSPSTTRMHEVNADVLSDASNPPSDTAGSLEIKEITIEHKIHEKPAPFQHLSGKDFSEIVFEGTSKEKVKKKQGKQDASESRFAGNSDDAALNSIPDECSNNQDAKNANDEESNMLPSVADIDEESTAVLQISPEKRYDNANGDDVIAEQCTDQADEPTDVKDNGSIVSNVSVASDILKSSNAEIEGDCAETSDVHREEIGKLEVKPSVTPSSCSIGSESKPSIPPTLPNFAASPQFVKPTLPEKPLKKSTRTFKTHRRVFSTGSQPMHQTINPLQWKSFGTANTYSSETKRKDTLVSGNSDVKEGSPFDILIRSTDSSTSEKSLGERCRRIAGEAIERIQPRKESDNRSLGGGEDSIEANLLIMDEDEATVEVVIKEKPQPTEFVVSPFPAPQMSLLSSIYSQDRLSLSDMSVSEHCEDDLLSNQQSQTLNENQMNQMLGSLSLNSYDSDDMTDIEDNRCDTPPVSIDEHGAVEMSDVDALPIGIAEPSEGRTDSGTCSPSGRRPLSPSSAADKITERLRLLADSWAEISPPTCGQIQHVCISETLVWAIDIHDHIFCMSSSGITHAWKKVDGRVRQIASDQYGTVVWSVCRKHYAYYRTNIKEQNPQGSDWYPVEKDILCISVDYTCVWGIKTNGDVFVRTGVSHSQPQGTGWKTVRVSSDLISITSLNGVVWALDIYNHVQMYQGDLEKSISNEVLQWKELPGINAIHVSLGPKNVGWIIDCDGGVWFNPEICQENASDGKWYQLALGEYLLHDPSLFTTVWSLFKRGHIPKVTSANEVAGVWILGKFGSIHSARGHLLGTRWDICVPQSKSLTSCWTSVTTADNDFVWALQPNNELHCFQPSGLGYKVQVPVGAVFKYISCSTETLWALTNTRHVYVRTGINETCPQGLKWALVDMTTQGNERLVHISCGNLVVWAVDYCGNVWFEMGRIGEKRQGKYAPGWVQVDGTPIDGCKFTKVVVSTTDRLVWACDDHNNVYARRDVTDTFLIGSSWEIVTGTAGKEIAISDTIVWALCPNGDVVCRFGVSDKNFLGDYWKKVPGCFEHLSVGTDDELWGIDRQGQLYRRATLHFFGTQVASKVPSYSQLFPTDEEWELI